jgi:HPt (histidine-containing phosphotransfer) domain-containing protein
MRELFLEKGFNDLLAKPIDVSKLDEILGNWIPKDKIEWGVASGEWEKNNQTTPHTLLPASNFPVIAGVDVQRGIAMTGGTVNGYFQVLSIFCKDTEDRLPLLQTIPDGSKLPAFTTQVHAIKSASASIGAAEVSAIAAELETAGKAADLAYIREKLPELAEHLAKLLKEIRAWETFVAETSVEEQSPADNSAAALQLLRELQVAFKSEKAGDIERILDELTNKKPSSEIKEALVKISDHVLIAEFGQAEEILADLLNRGQ